MILNCRTTVCFHFYIYVSSTVFSVRHLHTRSISMWTSFVIWTHRLWLCEMLLLLLLAVAARFLHTASFFVVNSSELCQTTYRRITRRNRLATDMYTLVVCVCECAHWSMQLPFRIIWFWFWLCRCHHLLVIVIITIIKSSLLLFFFIIYSIMNSTLHHAHNDLLLVYTECWHFIRGLHTCSAQTVLDAEFCIKSIWW